MKVRMTLLTVSLLLAQRALAKDVPLTVARDIANTTTPASVSQTFDGLENQSLAALRDALKGDGTKVERERLEKAAQSTKQADTAWLKASGYDFKVKDNQQAGIELLSTFSALPAPVLDQNLKTVEEINLNATSGLRHQALADAEGISYLYFLSDALGPRLGKAFIAAYDKGELGKAAALIKASEVSTGAAKKHFDYKRPFLIQGNTIHRSG